MSHKLQIGEMRAEYLTDKEIWAHFNFIFSEKSRNSTNSSYTKKHKSEICIEYCMF